MPQHGLHVGSPGHASLPVVGPSRLAVRLRLVLEHVGSEALQYQRAQVSFVVRLALVIAACGSRPKLTHSLGLPIWMQGRHYRNLRVWGPARSPTPTRPTLAQQLEVTDVTRLTLTTATLGMMSALSASSRVSELSSLHDKLCTMTSLSSVANTRYPTLLHSRGWAPIALTNSAYPRQSLWLCESSHATSMSSGIIA